MNREQFIERLAFLLDSLPEDERDGVLDYYNDYFDEAGEENEADVIQRLGNAETVASVILASMNENHEENGEFTEKGFEDLRFSDIRKYPDIIHDVPMVVENSASEGNQGAENTNQYYQYNNYYQNNSYKKPMTKSTKIIIAVIVCLCLSPILLPIAGVVVAVVLGVLAGLLGVFVGLGLLGAVFVVSGLSVGFIGVMNATMPGVALLVAGIGLFVAALGVAMIFAFIGLWGGVFPSLIKRIVRLCKKGVKKGGHVS